MVAVQVVLDDTGRFPSELWNALESPNASQCAISISVLISAHIEFNQLAGSEVDNISRKMLHLLARPPSTVVVTAVVSLCARLALNIKRASFHHGIRLFSGVLSVLTRQSCGNVRNACQHALEALLACSVDLVLSLPFIFSAYIEARIRIGTADRSTATL